MTRRRGRCVVLLTALAALVAQALPVGPFGPAGSAGALTIAAPNPDVVAAQKGLAYVATQQQPDGGFEVAGFPGFETPEAVLATATLANVEAGNREWSARQGLLAVQALSTPQGKTALDLLDDLADGTGDDAISPGLAAKLITLVAAPLCIDPARFDPQVDGPTDLVARMLSGQRPNGAFGEDGVFSFTLYAVLAHVAIGRAVPAETVAYVKGAQESDGSYNFAGDPTPPPPSDFDDIDTTGLAVQALVAAGTPTSDPSVANAVSFLRSRQASDGSWGDDSNSTAVAALALEAAGVDVSQLPSPYAFLRSLQRAGDGRFTSPNDGLGVNTYATTQAVRALLRRALPVPVAAGTCANQGYVLFAADGGVFALGGAEYHGSMGGARLDQPVLAGTVTPSGRGYLMFAADGGVFAFGDAVFLGSLGGKHLNSPVVGGAVTPSGRGYVMFAADGGVFTFGDAVFAGSLGDRRLNSPVVAGAVTPSGKGYVLFAADGGVFAFGDAPFLGSLGDRPLTSSVVDGVVTPSGRGYALVGGDGGVFTFGNAPFLGSLGARSPAVTAAGISMTPSGRGYLLFARDAAAYGFGDSTAAVALAGVTQLRSPVVAGSID